MKTPRSIFLVVAPAKRHAQRKSWSWMNIGDHKHFDGAWDGGALHLEWNDMVDDRAVSKVAAATLTLDGGPSTGAFESGWLVHESSREGATDDEEKVSTLKASLSFEHGTVTVCMKLRD